MVKWVEKRKKSEESVAIHPSWSNNRRANNSQHQRQISCFLSYLAENAKQAGVLCRTADGIVEETCKKVCDALWGWFDKKVLILCKCTINKSLFTAVLSQTRVAFIAVIINVDEQPINCMPVSCFILPQNISQLCTNKDFCWSFRNLSIPWCRYSYYFF